MDIQFIGTGSAFCTNNYHSNALITENGKHILIDAGGDLRFSLYEQGLSYRDIDAVYISHFHTDHIGGLEYLAFKSYFDHSKCKIRLFIHEAFIESLWQNSLKAGLGMIFNTELQLSDYFDIVPVKDDFIWEGIPFELIETLHVSESYNILPVYGLLIGKGKKVYITGDTRYTPGELHAVYERADLIIHDTETSEYKSIIHSHFEDLLQLPQEIKSKTYLWHYQDNVVYEFDKWQQDAKASGFKGFLRKGDRVNI